MDLTTKKANDQVPIRAIIGACILPAFVVFLILLSLYAAIEADSQRSASFTGRTYDLERQLRLEGYYEDSWILGEIHSPAFLVELDSASKFIQKLKELKPKNIFIDDDIKYVQGATDTRSYYIFTENLNVGYYYRITR